MLAADGSVLYVGKAKNLKKRLASYFKTKLSSPKTQVFMEKVHDVQVIVTSSENEALLLESNIIKKEKPRYNVLLRDDKSYPYIFLSTQHEFPRLDIHRGARGQKGHYFGPYPSAWAVRDTLNLLQKLFKLRQCRDSFFTSRSRPCLQYQIKRCTAPCVDYVTKPDYAEQVHMTKLFLEGKNEKIISDLIEKMNAASTALAYEQATQYRNLIANLRQIQKQQWVTKQGGDIDVIALAQLPGGYCVHVMYIRGGRVIGSKSHFPRVHDMIQSADVVSAFIPQYYLNPVRRDQIPKQVLVNTALEDKKWLEDFLSEQKGQRVILSTRVRGTRARWLQLATKNAEVSLSSHLSNQANTFQRFQELQKALKLETMPERLECFDISHSSGEATVASCVVFDGNGPLKSHYRRFNIKGITKGDDYAAIKQALTRRYTRIKSNEGHLPDVLFIDGGKGQLSQALQVVEELQMSGVLLVGVAKGASRKSGLETLFFSAKGPGIHLPPTSLALHLIQEIRDEAHRFAITGHRQRRDKKRISSSLESIEGIGAKRRQQLLQRFGGLQGVKNSTVAELAAVPGISHALAKRIHQALHD